jgi:hypothetical protein
MPEGKVLPLEADGSGRTVFERLVSDESFPFIVSPCGKEGKGKHEFQDGQTH